MRDLLISLPNDFVNRIRAVIPGTEINRIVSQVLEKEVKERELEIYESSKKDEYDEELNTSAEAGP